jgi:uncharacterized protein YcbK (DUF882 family)
MIIKWSRGNAPRHVAEHFHLSEFECGCGTCQAQMIDSRLLVALDLLRESIKAPIIITSGYRCPAHNKAVKGAKKSRHLAGEAADIYTIAATIEELEKRAEEHFSRIGVGKTFIHVDVGEGKSKWVY